jgi:SAM-dependent methyltransferase
MAGAWFEAYLDALPGGARVLELGCGPGEDAAALVARGFEVVACDRGPRALGRASVQVGTGRLLRVDHSCALPFIDATFGLVVASLSLHYFDWQTTVAAFGEVRRVLASNGALLFRVNATDDVNFGAQDGIELEPNYRAYERSRDAAFMGREYGDQKRFFDEDSVLAALEGRFVIESLRHVQIDRWEQPKQTWECLARAAALEG